MLEVVEEPVAEVGEEALSDPAGEVRLRDACEPVEGPGGEEARDDPAQQGQVVPADALIDRDLREEGRGEGGPRGGEEGDDRDRRPAAVRPRQAKERGDAAARARPAPVVHRGVASLHEVVARLVHPHAVASSASVRTRVSTRPCS